MKKSDVLNKSNLKEAGKGESWRKGTNYKAYRENYAKIFCKNRYNNRKFK